ncbi:MAG: hypothetical protein AVDCRST_MAG91-2273 [uncultured Sphingomonadaceae bacterium]|uniref:Uncharacterized protein n=1 Tax=uncultured Sphingomonadaceae bacterium TaxID=169976 RepID=A0A6J4TFE6_9SPHN|nr:MAG: hypothetical protein AVDCRST_MAG91-2273 [uncultured Sphingomonadaceae bacterium]
MGFDLAVITLKLPISPVRSSRKELPREVNPSRNMTRAHRPQERDCAERSAHRTSWVSPRRQKMSSAAENGLRLKLPFIDGAHRPPQAQAPRPTDRSFGRDTTTGRFA